MKLPPVEINKDAPPADMVFESLRDAIISGELKVGEPLRQDAIANHFNTSRIPVREAITRLEQQGLVVSQRFKGATVAGISVDQATEIFDFRALVEAKVMKDAVARMSPELLREARGYCEQFYAETDPMQWGRLNRDFHVTLYKASPLKFHLDVITNAQDRVDPYLRAQLMLTDGMQRANEEHLAILEACEAGDAELAAERTVDHILGARDTLVARLTERAGVASS